jgi:hypothetical protein
MKFNPLYEVQRLTFYLERDGLEAAKAKALELKQIYLKASLTTRIKYHTRSYPFRYSYIESAYSARHILRNIILDKIAKAN